MRITVRLLVLATTSFAVIATVVLGGWLLLERATRVRAASVAFQLSEAIGRQDADGVRGLLVVSPVFADRSQVEKDLLTQELLNGEISAEGIGILTKHGEFGPAQDLFPAQAAAWVQPYGICPSDCVAFKLERGSLTAELVLHRQPDGGFKVLRANDIRQLAEPYPTP